MAVTMLTYPKNLEGSITILGETGSVKVGGVAVNEIQTWDFAEKRDYDDEVKSVNYETTSVYGFGHPLYYKNIIDVMRGQTEPETDGREGLKSLEFLTAHTLPLETVSRLVCRFIFRGCSILTDFSVHETAIIDLGAVIGTGSRIWHWAHVCGGANIGKNVSLGQNVFVGNKVQIGDNCKVQNNVSVYDNVTLEEGVFCGPSMVFTNVYNPRSLIERKDEYRDTLVGGEPIAMHDCCGVEIGMFAFVGAGAVVNKNVKSYALVVGIPAKQIGWVSEFGEQLDIPLDGNASCVCKNTGKPIREMGTFLRKNDTFLI